jgi:capsular polysaccharide export protein|tara:strand:- start:3277 stop:4404 length:1128 start_codon:yes stop_codon:yes gene_type:complete
MHRVLLFSVNRSQKEYFQRIAGSSPHITALHDNALPMLFIPRRLNKKQSELCKKVAKKRLYIADQDSPGYRVSGIKRIYKKIEIYLSIYFFIHRVLAFFDKKSFEMVGLWSGRKWRQHIVSELFFESTAFVYFENGGLPRTTTVDSLGVNYSSSIPRDPKFYNQYRIENVELPKQLIERKSKKKISADSPTDLPERFIFVPFQVDSDIQIVEYSPWIHNMKQFYNTVVELKRVYGEKIPKIVIKEHPSSVNDYSFLHTIGDDIIFRNSVSTQDLIERSELVITINSSVGLEAILLNKPVIALGNAFYNIDGLVDVAEDFPQLIKACENYQKPLEPLRSNFLSYLYNEYYVEGDWRVASEDHISSMISRLDQFLEK